MTHILAELGLYPALILAGAFGGVLRWLSARDRAQAGLLYVLIGGIVGNYAGPWLFGITDWSAGVTGVEPQTARLGGAHLMGFVGIAAYTYFQDRFLARPPLPPASPGKEETP